MAKLKDARFCPFCSVASLMRDEYSRQHGKKLRDGRSGFDARPAEFVCLTCGAGFAIVPSLRYEHATTLFAEHRKLRPPQ